VTNRPNLTHDTKGTLLALFSLGFMRCFRMRSESLEQIIAIDF
jgi:hypothetical protein